MRKGVYHIIIVFILSLTCLGDVQGQATWTSLNGPMTGDVQAIASLSEDNSILLVLTNFMFGGCFLYRSEDSGLTWTSTARLANSCYNPKILAVDDRAVLVSYGLPLESTELSIIQKSSNGGRDWSRVAKLDEGITDMAFLGRDLDIVVSTSRSLIHLEVDGSLTHLLTNQFDIRDLEEDQKGNLLAAGNDGLFLVSKDGAGLKYSSLYNNRVKTVKVSESGDIWIDTFSSVRKKSTNLAWDELPLDGRQDFLGVSMFDDRFYAKGEGHLVSLFDTNGALILESKIPAQEIHEIGEEGQVLLGGRSGLFTMDINTGVASPLGFPKSRIRDIEFDSQDRLYISSEQSGIWSLANNDEWKMLSNLPPQKLTFGDKDELYFNSKREIYKSSDYGEVWQVERFKPSIQEIYRAPNDRLVFLSSGQVFQSDDGGETTELVGPASSKRIKISGLAFSQMGKIFGWSKEDVFVLSEDSSWISLGLGPSLEWKESVKGIVTNKKSKLMAYGDFGIFIFLDGEKRWKSISTESIDCLDVFKETIVACAKKKGVIRSNDSGVTWNNVSEGIPRRNGRPSEAVEMTSINFNSQGQAFLGTAGWGVFKLIE